MRHIPLLALVTLLLAACGASERAAVTSPTTHARSQVVAYPVPPTATLGSHAATKQAELTEVAHLAETNDAGPTSSTPYVFHPYPTTAFPPQPTGISNDCESINPNIVSEVTSCWAGSTGGREVGVVAGESSETAGHGAIFVYDANNTITSYITSQETGRITITAVQDGFFTFRGANGTTVIFDTAARQWVASVPERTPDAALPTAEPIATPLPMSTRPRPSLRRRARFARCCLPCCAKSDETDDIPTPAYLHSIARPLRVPARRVRCASARSGGTAQCHHA